MGTFSSFFTLLDQCCDGETYLRLGEACATTGECYDTQRPMGAVYWFSLPYRLGLDGHALVFGHLLLLAISILLSTLATGRGLINHHMQPKRYLLWAGLAISSALIHLVFLYPLLRVSLSDMPAGLLTLIGICILLLADQDEKHRWIKLAVAGLCLGLAVWIRAFYLYPLLVSISFWAIVNWKRSSFKKNDCWLLLALLPITIQYGATYNHAASFSFIPPDRIDEGVNLHMNDPAIGYDMIIRPREYWRWQSDCGEIQGLAESIKSLNMKSLLCLSKGRFNFYFGSYSAITYHNYHNFESYWGDNPLPNPQPVFELRVLESSIENTASDRIRNWSPTYLAFNMLALCLAITFMVMYWKSINNTYCLVALYVFLITAESLLIIPEQRFIIVPMIIIWLCCVSTLINFITWNKKNGSI